MKGGAAAPLYHPALHTRHTMCTHTQLSSLQQQHHQPASKAHRWQKPRMALALYSMSAEISMRRRRYSSAVQRMRVRACHGCPLQPAWQTPGFWRRHQAPHCRANTCSSDRTRWLPAALAFQQPKPHCTKTNERQMQRPCRRAATGLCLAMLLRLLPSYFAACPALGCCTHV